MRTGLLVSLVAAAAVACSGSKADPGQKSESAATAAAPETVDLQGAGATFPYPLYSKWVAEYQRLHPNVRINYQSIGSGGGIKQITERTVDFGATDVAMTDAELAKASGKLVHLPMTLGAVVVTYNLPGVPSGLKLTPEVITGIYLGEITKWNDQRIAELNPGVKLPGTDITVAHRSDGSGTTGVFTAYLAAVSPAWKDKVGAGKSVRFPVGVGAKGNEGVAGQVKTTPGAIGYAELAYAKQTGLPNAVVKNQVGGYVEPSLEAVTAAAAGAAASMPEDLRVSIVNAPGGAAYPIASFTYILVYQDLQQPPAKAKAMVDFLWWAVHDGQKLGPALDYAPLPAAVVARAEAKLQSLRVGGQAVMVGGP